MKNIRNYLKLNIGSVQESPSHGVETSEAIIPPKSGITELMTIVRGRWDVKATISRRSIK